jgi:DNA-binding winged helix-turn-helix (wHTH) protein
LREALGVTAGQMIETVRGAGYRLTAHVTPVTRPQVNA